MNTFSEEAINKHVGSLVPLLKRLGIAYVLLTVIFSSMLITVLYWTANTLDKNALDNGRVLVSRYLEDMSHRLGKVVKDNAWWDEAVANVIDNKNDKWLAENYGIYVSDAYHVERLLVLNTDMQVIVSEHKGEPTIEHSMSPQTRKQLQPIMQKALRSNWVEPDSETGFVSINGEPYYVGITAMNHTVTEEPREYVARPLLIFFQKVMPDDHATWATDLGLKSILWSSNPFVNASARHILSSSDGSIIGQLEWEMDLPGTLLIHKITKWGSIIFLLLTMSLLIVGLWFRRALYDANRVELNANILRESEARFKFLANQAPVLIWMTDNVGKVTFTNAHCKEILGPEGVAKFSSCWYEQVHPEDYDKFNYLFRQTINEAATVDLEFRVLSSAGDYRWLVARAVPNTTDNVQAGYIFSGTDITERKLAEEKIWQQANYDSLTGTANRNLFNDRLVNELNRGKRQNNRVAVICLDLDEFKKVNDSMGHSTGDQLLKDATKRMQKCLRDTDTIARLGGDEFAIVMPDIASVSTIDYVVQRIINALENPFKINGVEHIVTASIGIAVFPTDGGNGEILLKHADIAMYQAKKTGRNRACYFDQHMNQTLIHHIQLETDLRTALVEGQFSIAYQPVIDLNNGDIDGFEALIRWQHPRHGIIYPGEFIPIAEHIGLIADIGSWVLRHACTDIAKLNSGREKPLSVAVNVSSLQFQSADFHDQVKTIIQETGIDAGLLQLEITESVLMEPSEHLVCTIELIRRMGVKISADDFGTGFSSLSFLRKIKVDNIKIDGSFIDEIPGKPEDINLCRGIIMLAKSQDIEVIAEGVENRHQVQFLKENSCERCQGFFYSKALPIEEIRSMLDPSGITQFGSNVIVLNTG